METKERVLEILRDAQSAISHAMMEIESIGCGLDGSQFLMPESMTFAELKDLLDSGKIRLVVGDNVRIKHSTIGVIDWTVIGVGIDAQPVGAKRQTVTLQMTHCMEEYRWFSKPNKKHPWGHNAWDSSCLRWYLNGEFLDGLSDEDKAALIPVEKTTYHNNEDGGEAYKTVDKVFVLSASELGFTRNNIKNEGAVYPFFDGHPEHRKKTDAESGDESFYWVRSPYPSNAYSVRYVGPGGSLNGSSATIGGGAAAACVI